MQKKRQSKDKKKLIISDFLFFDTKLDVVKLNLLFILVFILYYFNEKSYIRIKIKIFGYTIYKIVN